MTVWLTAIGTLLSPGMIDGSQHTSFSDSDHEQTLCNCASARRVCRIHSGCHCRHLGISESDIVAVHARYPIPAICFSVLRRALAASGGRLQWPLISSSLYEVAWGPT